MVKSLEDRLHDGFRRMGELGFVLIVKNNVYLEERELGFWRSECLDLLSSIVDVVDVVGVFDFTGNGEERSDAVDETMH